VIERPHHGLREASRVRGMPFISGKVAEVHPGFRGPAPTKFKRRQASFLSHRDYRTGLFKPRVLRAGTAEGGAWKGGNT